MSGFSVKFRQGCPLSATLNAVRFASTFCAMSSFPNLTDDQVKENIEAVTRELEELEALFARQILAKPSAPGEDRTAEKEALQAAMSAKKALVSELERERRRRATRDV